MVINKKRISSFSYFAEAVPNTPVYVKVDNVGRFKNQLKLFGFQESDDIGSSILPCAVNRYARKNAEEFYTVDKSLPKEDYTQTVYWTRYEWAGKDQLNPVTDFSYINKKRYHRNYFAPYSVYFTLAQEEKESYIISDAILYTEENHGKLLNTVNMHICFIGECTIDFAEPKMKVNRVVVNWDILPKGEYPWETIKGTLSTITKERTKTQTQLMLRNCELINAKKPDFVAYGRSGFKGYIVFGFTNRNLYVLESAIPNNATYVLQDNWEAISKLSKAEILSQELHKARIIHSENWTKNFDKIMEDNNG